MSLIRVVFCVVWTTDMGLALCSSGPDVKPFIEPSLHWLHRD